MEIRRVTAAEWRELRAIRLRALLDSPQAFGGRHDEALQRPDSFWIEWAERAARSDTRSTVLAWDGETAVAIAGIFEADGTFTVFSMWTDPAYRGQGLAQRLLDAVVPLAGDRAVTLSYTEGNDAARRLYERYGFVETGETEPLHSDPSLLIRHMRLER